MSVSLSLYHIFQMMCLTDIKNVIYRRWQISKWNGAVTELHWSTKFVELFPIIRKERERHLFYKKHNLINVKRNQSKQWYKKLCLHDVRFSAVTMRNSNISNIIFEAYWQSKSVPHHTTSLGRCYTTMDPSNRALDPIVPRAR